MLRKERGITLVALVITVVVLLILAGVSIAALTNGNSVITKAQEAQEAYNQGAANDDAVINGYLQYIPASTGE